ncbi:MAG: ABC transporter substrate-binding protein [Magnetococcales bacterium]|nr:ABC transporter substrate-binding protein [Magnetococcales bacterium]
MSLVSRWAKSIIFICFILAEFLPVPFVYGSEESLTRLIVSLPGPYNISYLPLEIIPAIGADRQEGTKVQFLYVGGGGQAIKNLQSRNSDFAVAGLPAQMSAIINGGQLVPLVAIDDTPLFVLMVRSQLADKIHSVSDLRGKKIGVNTGSLSSKTTSQQLMELLLRANGVRVEEVNFQPSGQDWEAQSTAILSGSVDAIMGDEPFASRLLEDGKVFFLANLADPVRTLTFPGSSFLHAVLSTRPDFIKEQPEKVATMMRIMRRTLAWVANHSPEDLVAVLNLDQPEDRRYFLDALRKYPHLYSPDGKFSRKQLHETEVFFKAAYSDNKAAASMRLEEMFDPRWSDLRD